MQKLERFAPIAVISAVLGCASSTAPPPEAAASPPPHEPSAEPASGGSSQESTGTSTSASTKTDEGGTEKGGASEGKWEGEEAAVGKGKPAERTAAETRTTEVIQKIVLDNRKPVRECYDKARKDLPDLKGKMTIKFVLDPDGKVKTAELSMNESDIKSPLVVNCAIDVLKKIKFPPSSRGMDTTVNYPFDFKPQGGGK